MLKSDIKNLFTKQIDKKMLKPNVIHFTLLTIIFIILSKTCIVYINQVNEFLFPFSHLIFKCLYYLVLSSVIIYFLGLILNQITNYKCKNTVISMLTGFIILLWLQGYFFLWDYGTFDGRPVGYDLYNKHGIIEIFVWVAILFITILKSQAIAKLSLKICSIVIIILIANISYLYITKISPSPVEYWFQKYEIDPNRYYTFSKQKNIIIIVVDGARSDIFEEIYNTINEEEKEYFNGYTFFKNTTGSFNITYYAVSAILTGKSYDFNEELFKSYKDIFTSNTSLPYRLKNLNYFVEVYPYDAKSVYLSPEIVDNIKKRPIMSVFNNSGFNKIFKLIEFNFLPHFLKRAFFESHELFVLNTELKKANNNDLPQSFVNYLGTIRRFVFNIGVLAQFKDGPVFKYYHFHGAHPPFFHDENLEPVKLPFNIDSYKRKYQGFLVWTLKSLQLSLTAEGVYDDTMIIVAGDHGFYIPEIASLKRKQIDNLEIIDQGMIDWLKPLLLIKPFNAPLDKMKTSTAPASIYDIPATIYDALNLDNSSKNISVFKIPEQTHRIRTAYSVIPPKIGDLDESTLAAFENKNPPFFEIEIDCNVDDITCWKPTYKLFTPEEGSKIIDVETFKKLNAGALSHLTNRINHDRGLR